jgi:integrase
VGWVVARSAGFKACWRDPAGKERSKTFKTEDEAYKHLGKVEGAMKRGSYVDPAVRKVLLRDHAARWLKGRDLEARTNERTMSLLRTHVIPKWGAWPVGDIDHMEIQTWVVELGRKLAPATVAKCHGLLSMMLVAAVRSRIIDVNPADGVRLPKARNGKRAVALTRAEVFGRIIPAINGIHGRIPVWLAAGTGLRWGECAGLAWGAVDLENGLLHIAQVAVETPKHVTLRPYPKSAAGVRSVPMGTGLSAILREHRDLVGDVPASALMVNTRTGAPARRANFRKRIWRPALVRAGLLGEVSEADGGKWRGAWTDGDGRAWEAEFDTEVHAVAQVASRAAGGPRFHDLRHSYATWLVSDGVAINDVQRAMGHSLASTTLDLYTHTPAGYEERIRRAVEGGSAANLLPGEGEEGEDEGGAGVPARV